MDCVGLTGTIYLTPWGKYVDLARVVSITSPDVQPSQHSITFSVYIQLLEAPLQFFSQFSASDKRNEKGERVYGYVARNAKGEMVDAWWGMSEDDLLQFPDYTDFKAKYDALLAAWIEVTNKK